MEWTVTCRVGAIKCRAFAVPAGVASLDLARKKLSAGAATLLAGVLKFNAVLTELNLTYNSVGTEGAKALASSLEVNAVLTSLNLWGNK